MFVVSSTAAAWASSMTAETPVPSRRKGLPALRSSPSHPVAPGCCQSWTAPGLPHRHTLTRVTLFAQEAICAGGVNTNPVKDRPPSHFWNLDPKQLFAFRVAYQIDAKKTPAPPSECKKVCIVFIQNLTPEMCVYKKDQSHDPLAWVTVLCMYEPHQPTPSPLILCFAFSSRYGVSF